MQSATPTRHQSHLGLDKLLSTARALPLDPAVNRFCFLRHGQTDGNRYKFFQPPNQPLNERGFAQARQAAKVLRDRPLSRIVASDMLRTLQTAAAIAEATGMQVQPSALLRERNFGVLVGTSSLLIDWTCDPRDGESLETFVHRVRQGLAESLTVNETLLVGHGGTLYVIASVLGIDIEESYLANATPLSFHRHDESWRIEPLLSSGNEEITLS